jgi:hypothetical protein
LHHNQVAKWRRRFIKRGLEALQDQPRADRKGNIATELLRQIGDQATRPPQGRPYRWFILPAITKEPAAAGNVKYGASSEPGELPPALGSKTGTATLFQTAANFFLKNYFALRAWFLSRTKNSVAEF